MMAEAGGQNLVVVNDLDALAEEAAKLFRDSADHAIGEHGSFRVALSGGSTPRSLYERLASEPYRDALDWSRMQVFLADERFVPPDSPESNFGMLQGLLLDRVPINERFVHPFATVNITPQESAALYEEGIRRVFAIGLHEVPSFDFVLLGVGPDGHTASLFPGTEALNDTTSLVVPNFVPAHDSWRITLTFLVLNAARRVVFLVAGAEKADIMRQIVVDSADLPAARVSPQGEVLWLVDQAAAAQLGDRRQVGLPTASRSETSDAAAARPVERPQ